MEKGKKMLMEKPVMSPDMRREGEFFDFIMLR